MLPSTLSEWLAWAGLVVPLLGLAWAAIRHVANETARRVREKDERLQELARIIYNQGAAYGLGAQILAIYELRRFKDRSDLVGRYSAVLRGDFTKQSAHVALFAELDALDAELGHKK